MRENTKKVVELKRVVESSIRDERDRRDLVKFFSAKNPNKHIDKDKRNLLMTYFEMAGKFGIREEVFDAITHHHGFKVNATDADGNSALLLALRLSAPNSVIMKLLGMGADYRYKTPYGLGVLEALTDSRYNSNNDQFVLEDVDLPSTNLLVIYFLFKLNWLGFIEPDDYENDRWELESELYE